MGQLQALAKGLGWASEAEETVTWPPAASHRARVQIRSKNKAHCCKGGHAQSECKAKRQQLKQAEDELRLNLVEVSPALTEHLMLRWLWQPRRQP